MILLLSKVAFYHLEYFTPLPSAWNVSFEKSDESLIDAPLYVTTSFSLVAFRILSLSLSLVILVMMCLGAGFFGSNLFGTLWDSWTCVFFLHEIREFLVLIPSNTFSIPCSLSSSNIPIMLMFLCFMLSKMFLKLFSFFKFFFHFGSLPVFFFYLVFQITDLIFRFI